MLKSWKIIASDLQKAYELDIEKALTSKMSPHAWLPR